MRPWQEKMPEGVNARQDAAESSNWKMQRTK